LSSYPLGLSFLFWPLTTRGFSFPLAVFNTHLLPFFSGFFYCCFNLPQAAFFKQNGHPVILSVFLRVSPPFPFVFFCGVGPFTPPVAILFLHFVSLLFLTFRVSPWRTDLHIHDLRNVYFLSPIRGFFGVGFDSIFSDKMRFFAVLPPFVLRQHHFFPYAWSVPLPFGLTACYFASCWAGTISRASFFFDRRLSFRGFSCAFPTMDFVRFVCRLLDSTMQQVF